MPTRRRRWLSVPVEPWFFRLERVEGLGPRSLAALTLVIMVPATLWAGTPVITPFVTAYTVAIAAYLIDRQERELGRLSPTMMHAGRVTELFERGLRRHPRWVLLLGWILGPLAMIAVNLAGPRFQALLEGSLPGAGDLWGLATALFFWLIFFQMLLVFGRNALLFHRLGAEHVRIDLLDFRSVDPFGRVAARNLLIFIGGVALAPLQLFSRPDYAAQIAVGTLIVMPCGLALVLLPMWSVHRRLASEKAMELSRIQEALAGNRRALLRSPIARDAEGLSVTSLVLYREMISGLREWPVDAAAVARIAGYVVIPLLAWVGAALVERWVDVVLLGG